MPTPKITIGLVLFRGEKYLSDCLKSLWAQKNRDEIEFLFCDHSPDGEAGDFLKLRFPNFSHPIFSRRGNHSEGHNFLRRRASAPLYFCASFDAVYAPDCTEKILSAADAHPNAAIFVPKSRYWNFEYCFRTTRLDSAGLLITKDFSACDAGQEEEDVGQFDRQTEILGGSGSALVFRKEALFFDEHLHYKNDVDLALRTLWNGQKTLFVPEALLWHDRQIGEKSLKSERIRSDSLFGHLYMTAKNRDAHFSWHTKIALWKAVCMRRIYAFFFARDAVKKLKKIPVPPVKKKISATIFESSLL